MNVELVVVLVVVAVIVGPVVAVAVELVGVVTVVAVVVVVLVLGGVTSQAASPCRLQVRISCLSHALSRCPVEMMQ